MIPLCTSATRRGAAGVRVGVDVVGRAVGGPAGVADAGVVAGQRVRRRSPSRGWRACRRACRSRARRRRRARSRRSRSRGTPAAAGPRSRRPGPACDRRNPTIPHMGLTVSTGLLQESRRMSSTRRAADEPRVIAVPRARPLRLGGARRARSRTRSPPRRSGGCAASATSSTSTRSQQVYLPLSRLLSLYVESAGRLHREQEEFLAPAAAAAHAVRDRPGRLGGGRQVDHRPRAPADARRTGPSTPTSRW